MNGPDTLAQTIRDAVCKLAAGDLAQVSRDQFVFDALRLLKEQGRMLRQNKERVRELEAALWHLTVITRHEDGCGWPHDDPDCPACYSSSEIERMNVDVARI